jgi:enoyl-CoA hydratase/carnithine racemase
MTAEYKVHGDVAVITLMNPPVNGLGLSTRVGITNGLEQANSDAAVKAIVITGGGKAFSGGADIKEFGSPKALQEPNLLSVIRACENSAKPVVAAVHSVAMGGGLELALGCHYRIAAPGTTIALPEVKLGLIPGAGGTQRLPRAVGKAKAMDLALTARMMDATEAERAGLVARVVPLAGLHAEAAQAATAMCGYSLLALMATKESVNRAYEAPLAEGLLFERRMFHAMFSTEDRKEGMTAFLEKRPPVFTHR